MADSELCRLSLEGSLSLGERRLKTGQKAQAGEIWNKVLREIQSEAGRLPLGDLIEKIFDQTAMIETAAAAHHGSQSASNLVKLARLAKSASDQEGLTLREFIERIAAESKAGKEAGESPLADDYWDCVRVLTIHKAKGLEFPVVMIPRISSKGRRVGASGAMTDWKSAQAGFHVPSAKATSAAMALLKIKEEERLEYEAVRLLYVALTRAEDKVFLIGGKEFSRGSFADFLSQSEGIPTKEITPQAQSPSAREAKASGQNSARLPEPEVWAELWKSRFKKANLDLGVWKKSPTDGPQELIAENGDSGFEEELNHSHASDGASLLGQLCHRALKKWNFQFPWDIKGFVEEASAPLICATPSAPWPDILRDARAILERFSRSQAALEISRSEILGQEVPFSYNEQGTVMRGVIDLVYRKENQIIIVDYKTGIPPEKEGSLSAESTRRYQEQAKIYGQAVERTLLSGVVDFRLIFLREPERQIRWYNEKDARGLNLRAGNK